MCSTTTAAFLKHTQCSVMTPLVPNWCTTARTKTPKYWFIALFHSLSPPSVCVCVHTEDAKANKNQYPLTRHTLALSLIYCLFFSPTPTIFILIFSAFPSTTCSYFSLPSLFFFRGRFRGHVLGRGNDIAVFVRVQDLGEVGGHGVCILSDVDLRETQRDVRLRSPRPFGWKGPVKPHAGIILFEVGLEMF